jgi:(S)-citramalyl-CoA lyase
MNDPANEHIRPRRSFIFTPGLKPEMFPKALASGADMVCIELEDGVAPKDKDEARKNGLSLFEEPQAEDGVERVVRINCIRSAYGIGDLQAILASKTAPPGLMLPKVNSPEEVRWMDELLDESGHACRLHIIIETNAGLEAAFEIAQSSPRIEALYFGGVDMSAELRCRNAWEPLLYARSRLVHAAAHAGIDAIDVPYLDLEDPEGMKQEAILARDLGFSGKGSIHPKQISLLNEVFTPEPANVKHARKILQAFEEADTGLVVVDGKLIEKPVLREVQRILAIHQRVSNP